MAGRNSDARVLAALEQADPGTPPATVPSFQELYAQYFEFVWTSARRLGVRAHAIDDVVQEIFIVIHSKLHTLQKPEALRSWIYGIVRRTASNHHRSRRARVGVGSTAVEGELESPQPTPFEVTQKNSDMELLAKLLAELDEPKREVFALVELDEMTVPEVAEALDIPLNTAYSRLRAARLAFEAALARHEARGEGR
jgi:RNA polymerase sigma-70 factor (ECF subfamily)